MFGLGFIVRLLGQPILYCAIACVVWFISLYQYGEKRFYQGKLTGIDSMQEQVTEAKDKLAKLEQDILEATVQFAEQLAKANHDYQVLKNQRTQKEKTRYVETQKIIEKPVYRNVCFDPNGLQELNRSINEL